MNKLRIKNLRSLKDTGNIELKDLIILVGKNSSGKSTLLRTFPLLKQTINTKRNEPILWYSKENVDYGSFEETINKSNKDGMISFHFNFDISSSNNILRYRSDQNEKINEMNIDLEINVNNYDIDSVIIEFLNNKVIIKKEKEEYYLEINDTKLKDAFLAMSEYQSGVLVPTLIIKNRSENIGINRLFRHFDDKIKAFLEKHSKDPIDKKEIDVEIQGGLFLHSSITIEDMLSFLTLNFSDMDKNLLTVIKEDLPIHYSVIKNLSNEYKKELKIIYISFYLEKIIDRSNLFLEGYFSGVQYIAPLRASAQRYYRHQGLSVDDIDPMGENIPMVIYSLKTKEKRKFEAWMKKNFGFIITTDTHGGHLSLNISFDNNQKLNLADTGFGFSQILPILLMIWRTENSKKVIKRRSVNAKWQSNTIVIEQPELHLHPALQAKLIDTLVKSIGVVKDKGITLKVILETHSETIINRVGTLISNNEIEEDDVNILIFGAIKENDPSNSSITKVKYNTDGIIEDWPLGFFYPEE